KDNEDKISDEDKAALNSSITKAKAELESNDLERMTQATKTLSDEVQPIFAKLYQNGANGGNPGGAGSGEGDTEFHQN
ncbi:MAG: hypothetical protein IJA15_02585, partial [Clostridia bacterium]|nr:hypothetical protein [Clostridia bacterium]